MKWKVLLVCLGVVVASAGCTVGEGGGYSSSPKQELINPPERKPIYERWHYSQAIRVGGTVYLAGQVGWDENNEIVEGFEAQTRLAFKNVERVLKEAGASMDDIVNLVTYHKNMDDLFKFAAIKDEFLPEHYPPWTVVGVNTLALPELLIEIRVTAVIGSGSSKAKEGSGAGASR